MRMENVRIGERFAFGDRGGVWQKTACGKAKNIYGENYGTEIDVPPDTPVYVHFGGSRGSHRGPARERRDGIQVESKEKSPTQQSDLTEWRFAGYSVEAGKRTVSAESERKPEAPEFCQPRAGMEGIGICVGDDSGEIIKIVGATASQVAAYLNADVIIVKGQEMAVVESAFNYEDQTVYIRVRA